MGRRHPGIRASGILGSQLRARRLFQVLSTHPMFEADQHPHELRHIGTSPADRLSREPPDIFVARLRRTFAFFDGALKGDPASFE